MSEKIDILIDRLGSLIAASGLSERKISISATGGPDAIRNIRVRRAMPGAERLVEIAKVLNTTPAYLLGDVDMPDEGPRPTLSNVALPMIEKPLPNREEMPKDIPVYGTAIGSEMMAELIENGQIAVEQTDLNSGDVIDFLRRPPALANMRKAYGLYIAGHSMEPAYESGSVVIADPSRPPQIRDYVIVYLRDRKNDADGHAASVLIKRLVRRSASFVELEQFNPAGIFRVSRDEIADMHRVVPWVDLIGI